VAVAFYEGLLGIPQVEKPAHLATRGGCWFEEGVVRVHLGVEDDFTPAHKAHPAFLIDDLSSLRRILDAADVLVTVDQPLPSYDRFYASDPFGNRLEFLQPSAEL